MEGIELWQLREGSFQRSPHSPKRAGLLLDDLIVENVEGSAMSLKIARHVTPFFNQMITSANKEQMRVFAASAQPERVARICSILPVK